MSDRVSRHQVLMDTAELFAMRGTCSRAKVGVVIAREGRILSTGYNGVPAGMTHCDHNHDPSDYPGCKAAVHAEVNAIAYAARYGIALEGASLYTTFSPCLACAQVIINSGIKRCYVKNKYRLVDGIQLMQDARIDIIML